MAESGEQTKTAGISRRRTERLGQPRPARTRRGAVPRWPGSASRVRRLGPRRATVTQVSASRARPSSAAGNPAISMSSRSRWPAVAVHGGDRVSGIPACGGAVPTSSSTASADVRGPVSCCAGESSAALNITLCYGLRGLDERYPPIWAVACSVTVAAQGVPKDRYELEPMLNAGWATSAAPDRVLPRSYPLDARRRAVIRRPAPGTPPTGRPPGDPGRRAARRRNGAPDHGTPR